MSGAQAASLDIDDVARLARIALSEGEKERFASQLAEVLVHFEKLQGVDVSGVEPSAHAHPVFNAWRSDAVQAPLPPSALEAMAPAWREHQVLVPKVVDEA